MKLLTKELREKFAKTGSQEKLGLKAVVIAKFFNPMGAATWYATEFDGEDTFFGFADLFGDPTCAELGYFSLSEMESVRLPMGLKIERDLYWTPKTLEEVKKEHGQ
jgi:hypothetical protein